MLWISRTKLKLLAWLVGIALATTATIVLAGLPMLPVLGVAVAAAAVSVGKATMRMSRPRCLACGKDLSGQPHGAHGIACPGCGSIMSGKLG